MTSVDRVQARLEYIAVYIARVRDYTQGDRQILRSAIDAELARPFRGADADDNAIPIDTTQDTTDRQKCG